MNFTVPLISSTNASTSACSYHRRHYFALGVQSISDSKLDVSAAASHTFVSTGSQRADNDPASSAKVHCLHYHRGSSCARTVTRCVQLPGFSGSRLAVGHNSASSSTVTATGLVRMIRIVRCGDVPLLLQYYPRCDDKYWQFA
jgi:hypothetical protein